MTQVGGGGISWRGRRGGNIPSLHIQDEGFGGPGGDTRPMKPTAHQTGATISTIPSTPCWYAASPSLLVLIDISEKRGRNERKI